MLNDPVNWIDPLGLIRICYTVYITTVHPDGTSGTVRGERCIERGAPLPTNPPSLGPKPPRTGGGNPTAKQFEVCRNQIYKAGKALETAGTLGYFGAAAFFALGVGEAAFFGTMTAGPGAIAAAPTFGLALGTFTYASYAQGVGSAMMGYAGDRGAMMNAITAGVLTVAAKGAGAKGYTEAVVTTTVEGVTSRRTIRC